MKNSNSKKSSIVRPSSMGIVSSVMAVLLFIQIFLILACNIVYMPKYLDGDFAKLATHIMEMAKTGQLAIDGWKYTTTAEWDCAVLFALPIYALTHSIYLSLTISNMILVIMYIWTIFYIFGKNRTASLISSNLLLIPYEFGMLSYTNMLFYGGSQYSIKVLVPLLLIGLTLKISEYSDTGKKVSVPEIMVPAGILLFLFFVTNSSSGIYVCMCGIFPLVAAYLTIRVIRYKKVPVAWLLTALCGMVLTAAGILINRKVMGGTRADSLTFVTFYDYSEGYLFKALGAFFSVFGASTVNENIPVASTYGIFFFLRILFVLVLIGSVILTVKRFGKRASLLDHMILSVFFWNLLIILVADVRAGSPTFEQRYFLIGSVPALLLLGERLSEVIDSRNDSLKKLLVLIYTGFLMLMLAGTYRNIICYEKWEGDIYSEYRELVKECDSRSIDTVYIYDRSLETDVCRLLSDETLYLDVLPNGYIYVNDYYGSYEQPITSGECFVAVPEVSGVFEEDALIFGREKELVTETGSIKLYKLAPLVD